MGLGVRQGLAIVEHQDLQVGDMRRGSVSVVMLVTRSPPSR
jgi:hypothetical protein